MTCRTSLSVQVEVIWVSDHRIHDPGCHICLTVIAKVKYFGRGFVVARDDLSYLLVVQAILEAV